jgi:DNA-binding transcriptional MerR regulator
MATNRSSLPIRAVSRLTGLSIDTLRAWERRYGAVVPTRGPRGRTYDLAQVARLRTLDTLVRSGHAIGTIAHLSDRQLGELRRVADGPTAPADPGPVGIDRKWLFDAVDRFDLPALDAALSRFAALLPPRQFVTEVAMPLMREIGERWAAGSLSISQEHLVSAIVRTVSGGLLRNSSRPFRPPVVFATPEGERHELGALCAAVICASEGWDARYAGPDLPADDIAAMAEHSAAAAVVLGVTIGDSRPVVRRIRQLVPAIPVVLGGAAANGPAIRGKGVHVIADLAELDAKLRELAG